MWASVFTDEVAPDLAEALPACLAAGVSHVQVRNVQGQNAVHLPDGDVARIAALTRHAGVRVDGIGSPFGKCDLANEAYAAHLPLFERAVRLAAALDTRLIRVFAFYARERRRPDGAPVALADVLPEVAERLSAVAERARREGLTLGLENEYTTLAGSCAEARSVVDAVGSPALRLCWDVASGWYTGEPVLPDGYDQARGVLCDVHVRDAGPATHDPRQHGDVCRLGEGAIDWPGIVHRLRASGYAGPCTLETHLYSGDPDRWPKLKAATVQGMRVLQAMLTTAAAASA